MIRVGIVGASGYAGGELVRLLACHPGVVITRLAGETKSGSRIRDLFPNIDSDKVLEKISDQAVWTDVDVVFFALPAGQSFDLAKKYIENGNLVIDLGPDYRLSDSGLYRKWYKVDHGFPEALGLAVYGLVEWARDKLREARLVSCPGCFPTGALMGLLPFHRAQWINSDRIIVDGKSGVTGAGRGLSLQTHFPEIAEGLLAYKVFDHRHVPEIEQALSVFGPSQLTFVPHLVPLNRGLLSTIYLSLKEERTQEEVDRLLETCYRDEPFVRRVFDPPNLMHVRGTNNVQIFARVEGSRLVVITAIDNMVKGAAGQAIQAMNLILGLNETEGLNQQALFP
ncbi:MAG: N-acetyl-gamma-glutamyl-phosphate reductase [Nitrospirota bacterium]|nr:N-acetyl-gamma-glutamyl-phosphate reductase [Nitrospirota bacterium]